MKQRQGQTPATMARRSACPGCSIPVVARLRFSSRAESVCSNGHVLRTQTHYPHTHARPELRRLPDFASPISHSSVCSRNVPTRLSTAAGNERAGKNGPGLLVGSRTHIGDVTAKAAGLRHRCDHRHVAGMSSGCPVSRTKAPRTTVGSSPAPRAVWPRPAGAYGVARVEDHVGSRFGQVLDRGPTASRAAHEVGGALRQRPAERAGLDPQERGAGMAVREDLGPGLEDEARRSRRSAPRHGRRGPLQRSRQSRRGRARAWRRGSRCRLLGVGRDPPATKQRRDGEQQGDDEYPG